MEELPMSQPCALHDTVMNNLHEKIEDLRKGQEQTQSLIKDSYQEVSKQILEIATLHREDIKAFKEDIKAHLSEHDTESEKRFCKLEANHEVLNDKFIGLKTRVYIAGASIVGGAITLGWMLTNHQNLVDALTKLIQ